MFLKPDCDEEGRVAKVYVSEQGLQKCLQQTRGETTPGRGANTVSGIKREKNAFSTQRV